MCVNFGNGLAINVDILSEYTYLIQCIQNVYVVLIVVMKNYMDIVQIMKFIMNLVKGHHKMFSKFLTLDEKYEILKHLRNEMEKEKVDKNIIPYLIRMNNIQGICTVQSCSGHWGEGKWFENDGRKYQKDTGYIAIRLSKHMWNELFNNDRLSILIPFIQSIEFKYWQRGYSGTDISKINRTLLIRFWSSKMHDSLEKIIRLLELCRK